MFRKRDGRSVPPMFRSEGFVFNFIRVRVAKGTIIRADEAKPWDGLHAKCAASTTRKPKARKALARMTPSRIF